MNYLTVGSIYGRQTCFFHENRANVVYAYVCVCVWRLILSNLSTHFNSHQKAQTLMSFKSILLVVVVLVFTLAATTTDAYPQIQVKFYNQPGCGAASLTNTVVASDSTCFVSAPSWTATSHSYVKCDTFASTLTYNLYYSGASCPSLPSYSATANNGACLPIYNYGGLQYYTVTDCFYTPPPPVSSSSSTAAASSHMSSSSSSSSSSSYSSTAASSNSASQTISSTTTLSSTGEQSSGAAAAAHAAVLKPNHAAAAILIVVLLFAIFF